MIKSNIKDVEKVEQELKRTPIKFGNFRMKIKLKVKHLGLFLDGDSLEASVSATVENRARKFKGAVFETKLINEELSTQSMGG